MKDYNMVTNVALEKEYLEVFNQAQKINPFLKEEILYASYEGIRSDILEFLAKNEFSEKHAPELAVLIEGNADIKWFELASNYADNQEVVSEIKAAFQEKVPTDYVAEYLTKSKNGFEMMEARKMYQGRTVKVDVYQEDEHKNLKKGEETEVVEVKVQEINLEPINFETGESDKKFPKLNVQEEPSFESVLFSMLGNSGCVGSTGIKDSSLLEQILLLVNEAITNKKESDAEIQRLNQVVIVQSGFMRQYKKQIEQLTRENEERQKKIQELDNEKKSIFIKYKAVHGKLQEISEMQKKFEIVSSIEMIGDAYVSE